MLRQFGIAIVIQIILFFCTAFISTSLGFLVSYGVLFIYIYIYILIFCLVLVLGFLLSENRGFLLGGRV